LGTAQTTQAQKISDEFVKGRKKYKWGKAKKKKTRQRGEKTTSFHGKGKSFRLPRGRSIKKVGQTKIETLWSLGEGAGSGVGEERQKYPRSKPINTNPKK